MYIGDKHKKKEWQITEFVFYAGINGQPVQRHEKRRYVILFATLKKLVLLLSFESSEVLSAYTLGYHRKNNNNNIILEALYTEQGFCGINRGDEWSHCVVCQCQLCGRSLVHDRKSSCHL